MTTHSASRPDVNRLVRLVLPMIVLVAPVAALAIGGVSGDELLAGLPLAVSGPDGTAPQPASGALEDWPW
ncbi:hypothetical protein [Micromonospora parathelypteridis]|uniref:Uncharacterized protein n=1 Tax=Micromonospora parathelypteridis TaxID=1839617 RepID=A0A840W9C9_9ACTN|nr:hypothetical protein [Micromonospora parathelypteridis]MBB5481330.1 hypothetical protein [Micromonospora parathelypteridis]GGO19036.1 hypothetical protein GCM10011576_34650 [Micromonospora parathelypteridis]